MENSMDPVLKTQDARLVGLSEAARYLGVTVRSVQNLVLRGVIQPVRIPGLRRTLFDRMDLEQLVKAGRP
jgi:excisionase family DNA binding protein